MLVPLPNPRGDRASRRGMAFAFGRRDRAACRPRLRPLLADVAGPAAADRPPWVADLRRHGWRLPALLGQPRRGACSGLALPRACPSRSKFCRWPPRSARCSRCGGSATARRAGGLSLSRRADRGLVVLILASRGVATACSTATSSACPISLSRVRWRRHAALIARAARVVAGGGARAGVPRRGRRGSLSSLRAAVRGRALRLRSTRWCTSTGTTASQEGLPLWKRAGRLARALDPQALVASRARGGSVAAPRGARRAALVAGLPACYSAPASRPACWCGARWRLSARCPWCRSAGWRPADRAAAVAAGAAAGLRKPGRPAAAGGADAVRRSAIVRTSPGPCGPRAALDPLNADLARACWSAPADDLSRRSISGRTSW